jgi:hypothetical protein
MMGPSIEHNNLRHERNVLRVPYTTQFSIPLRSGIFHVSSPGPGAHNAIWTIGCYAG